MTQTQFDQQILSLFAKGQKLGAVKFCKDNSSMGLKASKDYVDALTGEQESVVDSFVNIDEQLSDLIRQGRKLEAIKVYKRASGKNLKTSKDYIEALARLVSGTDSPRPTMPIQTTLEYMDGLQQPSFFQSLAKIFKKIVMLFTGDNT